MKWTADKSERILDFLVRNIPNTSKSKVKKLIREGLIHLDGEEVTQTNTLIQPNQTVEVVKSRTASAKKETGSKRQLRYRILHEDDDFLAIEKPAGVLSHSSDKSKDSLLQEVQSYLGENISVEVYNALGRLTSGILLFLKNGVTLADDIEIHYCALVEGHPPQEEGETKNWIKISESGKAKNATEEDGHLAVLKYLTLKSYPKHAILDVQKASNVNGQIRLQLSELGCPIVGDKKYGAEKNPFARLALHLFSMNFTHPKTGEEVHLSSATPNEFVTYGKGRS